MFRRGTQSHITHAELRRSPSCSQTEANSDHGQGMPQVWAFIRVARNKRRRILTLLVHCRRQLFGAASEDESDAKLMAKIFAPSDKVTLTAHWISRWPSSKPGSEGTPAPIPRRLAMATFDIRSTLRQVLVCVSDTIGDSTGFHNAVICQQFHDAGERPFR